MIFQTQEIDEFVMCNLSFIPEFPGKTIGSKIRFQTIYKSLTGKEINDINDQKTIFCKSSSKEFNIMSSGVTLKETSFVTSNQSLFDSEISVDDSNFEVNETYPTFSNSEENESIPTTSNSGENESYPTTSNNSEDQNTQNCVPLPKMPVYEESLEKKLKKEKIDSKIFLELSSQTALIDNSKHYGEIAKYLINKYPSVKMHVNSIAMLKDNSDRVTIQQPFKAYFLYSGYMRDKKGRILSERIAKKTRNLRQEKKKAPSNKNNSTHVNTLFYDLNSNRALEEENITQSEFHIEHLKLRENYSNSAYKSLLPTLLKDSFVARRAYMKSLSRMSLLEKLVEFNYFGCEPNLICEFEIFINSESFESDLERVLNLVYSKIILKTFKNKNNEILVDVFESLERKLNSRSRKVEWTHLFLQFQKNDTMNLNENTVKSPRICLIKNGNNIEEFLIVEERDIFARFKMKDKHKQKNQTHLLDI
ncbi:hypothetical protein BpHYR1_039960 [Brachionus plicatilis]|uniref:Uncharacterized protein n=1 Tax=Brachionus plicatilis TaxID=10195 RepID=A0A3M7RKB9_BRAPC|nr:hypothetical protein BpHYR1_039960 [Brachionus plicatilis]